MHYASIVILLPEHVGSSQSERQRMHRPLELSTSLFGKSTNNVGARVHEMPRIHGRESGNIDVGLMGNRVVELRRGGNPMHNTNIHAHDHILSEQ